MKKKLTILSRTVLCALVLCLAAAGCGAGGSTSGSSADSKTEYVIRLGHSDTEDNLLHISLQHYADYVKEQTDGRVVIRIYPAEELGDNTEMAQQLVTGELDAMMMPQGVEAV